MFYFVLFIKDSPGAADAMMSLYWKQKNNQRLHEGDRQLYFVIVVQHFVTSKKKNNKMEP